MKNKILNYIVCGIITLNLASCGNKTETKSKSEKESKTELKVDKTTKNQSEFVYSNVDRKIEMILENDVEFLVVGKPTKIYLKKENLTIRLSKLFVKDNEIDFDALEYDKNGFQFTIIATEKNLLDGNIEIEVTEKVDNGKNFIHKLLVPVKKL